MIHRLLFVFNGTCTYTVGQKWDTKDVLDWREINKLVNNNKNNCHYLLFKIQCMFRFNNNLVFSTESL